MNGKDWKQVTGEIPPHPNSALARSDPHPYEARRSPAKMPITDRIL